MGTGHRQKQAWCHPTFGRYRSWPNPGLWSCPQNYTSLPSTLTMRSLLKTPMTRSLLMRTSLSRRNLMMTTRSRLPLPLC